MNAHMYEGLKNKNYNPKPKQVQGWMVWGLVFRGWSFDRICTRGHRVSVGCARGKLTATKTEKSRPQPMSTGCRKGPEPCEAAPKQVQGWMVWSLEFRGVGFVQEGTGCPWDVRGGNSQQRRRKRNTLNRCQLVGAKPQVPARRHQVGQRTCHRCYCLFFFKKIYQVIVIINKKKDIMNTKSTMKGVYKGEPLGVLSHKVKFQQDVKI